MARRYYSNHETKKLEINFNQKIWRQDLAEFIKRKLNWDVLSTRVTRARVVSGDIKQFSVYDGYGRQIDIRYRDGNYIVYADSKDLIDEYTKLRTISYE